MYLTSKGLKNINWNNEELDFIFIFNNKEFKCNHFQANFIFPKLTFLKNIDKSINKYEIISKISNESFEIIQNLIFGNNFILKNENKIDLFNIGCEFNNNELIEIGLNEINYNINNIINYLNIKKNANLDISKEIEFISEHFLEFSIESFLDLDSNVFELIISNSKLIIKNENDFCDIIIKFIEKNNSFFLLKYIFFYYLIF